jgi:hypothetical protein
MLLTVVLAGTLVGVAYGRLPSETLTDLFPLVTGVVMAVWGYYFREIR